jgi:hypothetical protein
MFLRIFGINPEVQTALQARIPSIDIRRGLLVCKKLFRASEMSYVLLVSLKYCNEPS